MRVERFFPASYTLAFSLIVAALFLTRISIAQSHQTQFVPVAPEVLSKKFIRCIYKDKKGFIWFGTVTGLIRYDGTNIYQYEHDPEKGRTIPDNRINAIAEDNNNNLWVATAQGLMLYDPANDDFIDIDSIPGNTNSLGSKYITSISTDRLGRIWIGTHGQGLTVYDPGTKTFHYFFDNTVNNKVPPGNYVTSLYHHNDTVWVSTKGGLKLFQTVEMNRMPLEVDENLDSREITQVLRDVKGNIWLSTVNREIITLTLDRGKYKFRSNVIRQEKLAEAEGNVLTLASDDKGNIWAAGENTGLHFINGETGEITRHGVDESSSTKLPTNSIRSVYIDNTGITWIGTYSKGAFMIDNRAKKFELIERSPAMKSTAGNNVKGIAQDENGNIWLACDGGGLGLLDKTTSEIVFPEDLNSKLASKYLSSILVDDAGDLWVGTWGRGIFRVNTKTRSVRNFRIESHGFGDNKVFTLFQDAKKRIWVGSAGSGLFYFDPATAEFVGLNEEVKSDYIRKSAYVSSISQDADSSLWVGTLFGLYRLDFSHEEGTYHVTLYEKDGKPGSIASYDIQSVHLDARRNLWIGTGDNGVALVRYGRPVFSSIQKQDGLLTNSVRGILIGTDGTAWISTNMGLAKYDPVKNTVKNYTKKDGLYTNEFNARACLIGKDGRFYFGSDKGLVAFFPDSIKANPIQPNVYLTDLKLNSQSAQIGGEGSPLKKHISLTEEIELEHNQRAFALDFAAINYGQSSIGQYCYKLEGFDSDWNCIGTDTRATYTNIDPGRYVFVVKAISSDGIESDSPTRLVISIKQAPWKTWWAILGYALVATSFAYFLVRMRIERIRIQSQLEFEKMAREQEHALTESKTQFFTNISHEFRTPLSLIAMPLEALLSDQHLPVSVRERLDTMQSNTEKMTRLVNELMDFSKMENGKLTLSVRPGDLVEFITRVADAFNDVARKRNIHFKVHAMVKSIEGWFDYDKLEKIVVNLLSNAFKFASDNGSINLVLHIKESAEEQNKQRRFELAVIDNGIGIPESELPFVFDKFYQATSAGRISNPGTGVGLALTKALVELHRGVITAESIPEVETKFIIRIPLDRESYDGVEIDDSVGVRPASVAPKIISEITSGDVGEDRDRPRILVVEDNDELRNFICWMLRSKSHLT